jgi:hypothetical protein
MDNASRVVSPMTAAEMYNEMLRLGLLRPIDPADQMLMPSDRMQVAVYSTPGVTVTTTQGGTDRTGHGKLERHPY